MQQFDYNKYLNNNPLLKEAKGDETWFSDVNYFKKQHAGYKLKPTDMVSVGDSKVMTYADALKKYGLKESQEPIEEDLALVGNIALGVVGGLAGLYALVKTTKLLGYVAGQGLMALGNKLESSAKAAARGRRKEVVMGIVKKFEGDTELQSMYAALPPYSPKTKNERNKQMRKIAEYIKAKLNPEEMDYFNDISSMLRTGDLA